MNLSRTLWRQAEVPEATVSSVTTFEPGQEWEPDFLPGFERLTLGLGTDDEGDVVATLVRPVHPEPAPRHDAAPVRPGPARPGPVPATNRLARLWHRFWTPDEAREVVEEEPGDPAPPDLGVDLLYVHGWSDYFFQAHHAAFWEAMGVRFHAVDLRKYGRSLLPHQTPGYVTDLATYDQDLEAALAVMGHGAGPRPNRKLVVMGHSTGGLILSLWAARHPGRADALILNSPWLEFQTREVGRRMLEPGIGAAAALAPRSQVVFLDRGFYVRTISSKLDGEWDLDVPWRNDDAPWKPTSGWLAAIFKGHQQVARGLGLEIPVLVLLSARSTAPIRWSEDMMRTDTVLDVVGIARRATDLGHLCTLVRIDGALHDVTLSAKDVREVVWRELARWFTAYVVPD